MRRPPKYYSISRPKLRQSWNKYNFYNIARGSGKEPQIMGTPTFFQQKWRAKSKTRSYHGEHIPEKKWTRLFDPRLKSAVDMPPEYMAAYDGSEQALGTGSGLEHGKVVATSFSKAPGGSTSEKKSPLTMRPPFGDVNGLLSRPLSRITPHMQMIYAPLERRLDTAIFRALFASSVRQARQFVIHGAVKVNGKKMVHPSYMLNPGDMFQVEVEKVLYATGKQKEPSQVSRARRRIGQREEKLGKLISPAEAKEVEGDELAAAETPKASLSPEEAWKKENQKLKLLLKSVKWLLKEKKKDLSSDDKIRVRLFRTTAKRLLSKGQSGADMSAQELTDALALELKNHDVLRQTFQKFSIADEPSEPSEPSEGAQAETEAESTSKPQTTSASDNPEVVAKVFGELSEKQQEKAKGIMAQSQLSIDEMRHLQRLLKQDEENPFDETKPYATPWQPRAYMAPFAFIPRYLEVNPIVCAAVYLRHPVARPGLAEVPTPFSYLTNQLTHNYYVERGARKRV
ncbi:hypothetical protein B0I35DRAFT_416080 [Stachybotrys elegans]|uniref:Small ribosomal subunit protein uS4m n=1 Tax=Stachybotrys elegans TaxID=80388 RepID=A0A8K0WXK6_9HYPO|nr:hypothetical protein B0I35DRAFT_416080 [Stachybotrys elegans]